MASKSKTNSKDSSKELLGLLNFRQSLASKFGKDYRAEADKWVKDYEINSLAEKKVEDMDNVMQIPYIFSTIESNLPSIFETMPAIIMTQRGKQDKDFTEFADKVWDYVVEKIDLEEKVEQGGQDFLITGMGNFKWGWKLQTEKQKQTTQQPITHSDGSPVVDPQTGQPTTQDTINEVEVPLVDEPYVEVYSYKKVDFAPESEFVVDDEENKIPYIVCHHVMTQDEAEEKYGKRPSNDAVKPLDLTQIDKKMASDMAQEKDNQVKSDLDRVDIYEYYGLLPKSKANDPDWRSDKVYYTVFDSKEILKDPEVFSKKPFILLGNYGHSGKFFRFGEPKVLRELEQDISLGRSRIMDIRDKWGLKIWIPQGLEVDETSLKRSGDFTILKGIGQTPPQYLTPPPPPETVMTGIDQSRQDLQMASAQLDISRGGDTNTVDTATGQKIFQNATDKRNARKRKKIGNLIKSLARNLLVLCGENWDVEVFAQITDMDPQEIEQNKFVEKLKSLGSDYDVEIEVETITNNKETMAAQAIALYKETMNDPLVKHEEVLKEALKLGFNKQDFERFIKTPEELAAEQQKSPPPKSQVSVSVKADAGTPQGDEILQSEGLIQSANPGNTNNPENVINSLHFLVVNGLMQPDEAKQLASGLGQVINQQQAQQQNQAQNPQQDQGQGVGRPQTQDPTQVVQNSMPGADSTQITAQNDAAYKQTGVAKGPQNVQ